VPGLRHEVLPRRIGSLSGLYSAGRATSEKSAATGESGSVSGSAAASTEEADGWSQVRRFEHYEVMFDDQGGRAVYASILVDK
jgi:hypothetical protein